MTMAPQQDGDLGFGFADRQWTRREDTQPPAGYGSEALGKDSEFDGMIDGLGLKLMKQTPQEMPCQTVVHQRTLRVWPASGFTSANPMASSHSATMMQAASPASTCWASNSMRTGGMAHLLARLIRAKWMTRPTVAAGSPKPFMRQSQDEIMPWRLSVAQDSQCPR
jgi:hypothetical protein